MKICKIDCKAVTLFGITLSSSFVLSNPHETLTVMFQIVCEPAILQVSPARGMLMQHDQKYIKVRVKPELIPASDQLQRKDIRLTVNSTYFSEYNRKLMDKMHIRGWEQVSKTFQTSTLPVFISSQVFQLKNTIKRGDSLDSSERKTNSFEKFRQSSIKKTKNKHLDEDLEFIFRNLDSNKKQLPKNNNSKVKTHSYGQQPQEHKELFVQFATHVQNSQSNLKFGRSPTFNQFQPNQPRFTQLNQSPFTLNKQAKSKDVQRMPLKSKSSLFNSGPALTKKPNQSNRALELIILAVIAAVFVSIGQTVATVF